MGFPPSGFPLSHPFLSLFSHCPIPFFFHFLIPSIIAPSKRAISLCLPSGYVGRLSSASKEILLMLSFASSPFHIDRDSRAETAKWPTFVNFRSSRRFL